MRSSTEVVQDTLRKCSDGNIDRPIDNLTSDVEWQIPNMDHVVFSGHTYRGKEEVRKFFSLLSETQIVRAFEPREFIAQVDKVVVLGHYRWTVRKTGPALDVESAHVWTIREDRAIFRVHRHGSRLRGAPRLRKDGTSCRQSAAAASWRAADYTNRLLATGYNTPYAPCTIR